jgi:hypothetical protein
MSGKALFATKYAEAAQTTQYTSPTGTTTLIDGLQVANTTAVAATIQVNVVPSGGTAGATNLLQPTTTIAPNSKVTLLAGTWLNAGDFISTLPSAASTLVIHGGGRQFP